MADEQISASPETASFLDSGELTPFRMAKALEICASSSAQGNSKAWHPPSVAELQSSLPQYRIECLIASGGMGAVYRAIQPALDRLVAIKVLPSILNRRDGSFFERFKHEARVMAKLTHPGIVSVYESGETVDGLPFIVMELIEGRDLGQMIADEGNPAPKSAIEIVVDVCTALAVAHEQGIIHRDIKPSNVMIDASGRIKVTDFGLAKFFLAENEAITETNVAVGTPDFMAPEARIPGSSLDQRADIYAVGVMLYYMLAGELPRGRFPRLSQRRPEINKRLDKVIDRALQALPSDRFQSIQEMQAALLKAVAPRKLPTAFSVGLTTILFLLLGWVFAYIRSSPTISSTATHALGNSKLTGWFQPFANPEDIPMPIGVQASFVMDGPWFIPTHQDPVIFMGEKMRRNRGIKAVIIKGLNNEATSSICVRDNRNGMGIFGSAYAFSLSKDGAAAQLSVIVPRSQTGMDYQRQHLLNKPLPSAIRPGEQYALELVAIDQMLIARLNGQPVAYLADGRVPSGDLSLVAMEPFRNLEIIELDDLNTEQASAMVGVKGSALPEATAVNLEVQPPTTPWHPLLPLRRRPSHEGSVMVWRLDGSAIDSSDMDAQIPSGLEDVVSINLCTKPPPSVSSRQQSVFALRNNGSMVSWGKDLTLVRGPSQHKNLTGISAGRDVVLAQNSFGNFVVWPEPRSVYYPLRNVDCCRVEYSASGDAFCLSRRGYLLRTTPSGVMTVAACPPRIGGEIRDVWCSDTLHIYGAYTREKELHIWGEELDDINTTQRQFANVARIKDAGCALSVYYADGTWQILGGPLDSAQPFSGHLQWHWSSATLAVTCVDGKWSYYPPEQKLDLELFATNTKRCRQVVFNDKYAFGLLSQ